MSDDTPPGADVIERAKQLIGELCGGEPVRDDDSDLLPTARALQSYGDERAAAAIELLIADRDKWAALPVSSPCRLAVLNQLNWSINTLRAHH